ncbi:hypothetical protein [Actinacidiphila oryziradicis]|uniref:hypothetical protein n=1 Tax=Actinacidiphila oryziradicis TaxID=2571141 RepID=UPI001FE44513|nr:hypothetical protein [Actinacidiphila oryziradicis]
MDHDYGMHLTLAMGGRFGLATNDWPRSAQWVAPYLSIIANALDQEESAAFFEAARRAHHRELKVTKARTHQFGFAAYLSTQLDDQERTLARASAWEAIKAIHHIVRQDRTADFEQYIDCAIDAFSRSAGRQPVAADSGS